MATAESIARAGRARQIEQSKAASRRLIASYRGVWVDIDAQLTRLQRQIAAANAVGEPVRVSWLYQQQRLSTMQRQVTEAVTRFTGGAEQLTVAMMRQGAQSGADDAHYALQAMLDDAGLPPGLQIAFNRVHFAALDDAANNAFTLGSQAKSGAPRRTVAGLYKSLPTDMQKRAKQTIITAVATGQHPRVTARALKQQMGIGLNRALMIARTEQLNAYRRANLATFRANSDVCDGWIWLAAADACPFCASMNGTKHSLDETLESHPQCRCTQQPIPKPLSDILAAYGLAA